ncbi:MAG: hypothetical protein KDB08_00165 [Microthrixaceae bacterium]|nr:hypothetical protein [Microthrixaceae bacterium]
MRWFVVGQRAALVLGIIAVIGILWIDIATGLWQDYVILAGLAAGLVTFVLTALVVDRAVARSQHRRWAPLSRLAFTDMLHALADERASEVALGKIVPRTLAPVAMDAAAAETRDATARLRHAVVGERRQLTAVLSSWASFLAASADAGQVLEHAANIAERLDLMRDVTLEVDASTTHPAGARAQLERLNLAIEAYNSGVGALIDELDRVIAETNRLESM